MHIFVSKAKLIIHKKFSNFFIKCSKNSEAYDSQLHYSIFALCNSIESGFLLIKKLKIWKYCKDNNFSGGNKFGNLGDEADPLIYFPINFFLTIKSVLEFET